MKKGLAIIMAILFSLSAFPAMAADSSVENVALGKSYTIVADVPNEYGYGKDVNDGKLTDGKKTTSLKYSDVNYTKFVRAIGRTITIDLEQEYAITGVNCEFLQNKAAGVYCPQYLVISVSENGTDFMEIETLENPVPNDTLEISKAVYKKDFDKTYKARYVRFYFNVPVNCFTDEFEVFGKTPDGSEEPFVATPPREYPNAFASPDKLGGISDVMLLHTGYYPEDTTLVNNTVDSLVPYVGYISTSGRITDTMFDAFIFTYIKGRAPSEDPEGDPIIGVSSTTSRSYMSDWEYMLDKLFDPEYNIVALDKATERVKQALNLGDDFVISVYITLPYPKVSEYDFGDYDGDGEVEKISSTDDCVKVLEWFMDEAEKRWDEAGYSNLVLAGYYWQNESISYEHNEDELNLVKKTIEAVHKRDNKQIIAIPMYQASGVDLYNDIGFDCSFMQPNLPFHEQLQDNPEAMLDEFAAAIKKLGLAMEMEMHHGIRYDKRKYGIYYEYYLQAAVRNGMMTDTIHAYYQAAGPGVIEVCARSSDSYLRYLYDCTYKFIKHTLSFPEETTAYVENTEVETGKYVFGKIGINGDWYGEDVGIEVLTEPKNGKVQIFSVAQKYYYTPNEGFIGEDSFTARITFKDGFSEDVTVKINVVEEKQTVSEDNSSSVEVSGEESQAEDSSKKSIWPAVAIAGACAVIAAVAAVIFKKKKKK